MTTLAELLAAMAPQHVTYPFPDLPGTPTLTLRPLNADNPATVLGKMEREADGEAKEPTTVEELEAQRRRDAEFVARCCLVRLEIDGVDRTEDGPAFLVGLAVSAYGSRYLPMIARLARLDRKEATPEAIAGE